MSSEKSKVKISSIAISGDKIVDLSIVNEYNRVKLINNHESIKFMNLSHLVVSNLEEASLLFKLHFDHFYNLQTKS